MRAYILAIATAVLFAIPTATFAENIYAGPGGVKKGPSYGNHRYHNRYEGLYDLDESEWCRKSRAACTHKEELVEQGSGNCRKFRELCD